uniref:Tf2-1-like SH3-like domain-containing protein n=1 Tax=Tanacetum cinerariifolium TaxID=118510 RepID=A0A699HV85_TANCI|nr:hypothetical protein [Tanacetum cinerariifolium]
MAKPYSSYRFISNCFNVRHLKMELKGVVHFGKHRKLSPRYIGSFKILARVGPVSYTLEFPEELKGIHSTFHVSNLKRYLAEGDVVVTKDEGNNDVEVSYVKRDAITVDINAIALFRRANGSSPGRNDGTTSLESGIHVGMVMDDEVLHKLVSMVEKNELVEEVMIAVVDTEQNLSEFDS